MIIQDKNGEAKKVHNEKQLRSVLEEYGFRMTKINPDTKLMQKLKRELRFEKKNKSKSLMPEFTEMTIAKLESEIILEQDNCKQFKQI